MLIKRAKRPEQKHKIYLLLHGAWHASWCWEAITPLLTQYGHSVIVPDLPGHGHDKTPFEDITLSTYVDSITAIVKSCIQPVTLVGHSMAGTIISQVAENIPEKIEQLIYVAAFIPANHESLSQEAKKSRFPGVSTEMRIDEDSNAITLQKSQRIRELFFNTCSQELADKAYSLLQKEPLRPFIEPIHISQERFARIKKLYVVCLQDKALMPEDQRRMYERVGCRVVTLVNADHSPFYSAPLALAQAISGKTSQ